MDVVIRQAERSDVPAMLRLVKELAVFEREPSAVEVSEEEMADAGFGERPVWFGWVAEMLVASGEWRVASERTQVTSGEWRVASEKSGSLSGGVLGMAICYERYSTWKGRTLYLEDLVVKESVRGKRIGERLFQECVRYAERIGYGSIRWQVLDWNVDAIRFYERLGGEVSGGWLNGSFMIER